MTYKVLTEKNVPEIVELYQAHFSDGWNENMLRSAFGGGRFLSIGAYSTETLVGVVTCTKNFDDADIEGIVVGLEFRRKGVASVLIDLAHKELALAGAKKVFLEVRASNFRAIKLYEKHGYLQISVRKKYYSDGEDALVMVKEI